MKLCKKIAAVLCCFTVMLAACACGEKPTSEYDRLKTDIVGVWMDEGGPAVDETSPMGKSLLFYEFTSDGRIFYHYVNTSIQPGTVSDGTMAGGTFHIDENMFVFEGDNTGAIISINGDTLTMSNDSGGTNYTRVSMADAVGYSVFCKDPALLREQNVILYGEEYAAQSESESISQSIAESEAALTAAETAEETSAETAAPEESVSEGE